MDDFILSYSDVIEDNELDAYLIHEMQQESYAYSIREKMNKLLNDAE